MKILTQRCRREYPDRKVFKKAICREDFWEQVDVGKEDSGKASTVKRPKKVLQSTRLNYIM